MVVLEVRVRIQTSPQASGKGVTANTRPVTREFTPDLTQAGSQREIVLVLVVDVFVGLLEVDVHILGLEVEVVEVVEEVGLDV